VCVRVASVCPPPSRSRLSDRYPVGVSCQVKSLYNLSHIIMLVSGLLLACIMLVSFIRGLLQGVDQMAGIM